MALKSKINILEDLILSDFVNNIVDITMEQEQEQVQEMPPLTLISERRQMSPEPQLQDEDVIPSHSSPGPSCSPIGKDTKTLVQACSFQDSSQCGEGQMEEESDGGDGDSPQRGYAFRSKMRAMLEANSKQKASIEKRLKVIDRERQRLLDKRVKLDIDIKFIKAALGNKLE